MPIMSTLGVHMFETWFCVRVLARAQAQKRASASE